MKLAGKHNTFTTKETIKSIDINYAFAKKQQKTYYPSKHTLPEKQTHD